MPRYHSPCLYSGLANLYGQLMFSVFAYASPVAGLLVYQTDGTAGFYYYSGSAWVFIQNSNNANVTLQGNKYETADGLLKSIAVRLRVKSSTSTTPWRTST